MISALAGGFLGLALLVVSFEFALRWIARAIRGAA